MKEKQTEENIFSVFLVTINIAAKSWSNTRKSQVNILSLTRSKRLLSHLFLFSLILCPFLLKTLSTSSFSFFLSILTFSLLSIFLIQTLFSLSHSLILILFLSLNLSSSYSSLSRPNLKHTFSHTRSHTLSHTSSHCQTLFIMQSRTPTLHKSTKHSHTWYLTSIWLANLSTLPYILFCHQKHIPKRCSKLLRAKVGGGEYQILPTLKQFEYCFVDCFGNYLLHCDTQM